MRKKLEFTAFTEEVAGKIKSFLPERFSDAAVDLKVVLKNNDHKLTGLTIKTVDSNVAPTIYLEKFFEEYEDGKDLCRILEEIAGIRLASDLNGDFHAEDILSFESCKDKIVPRLVSLKMNQSLLEDRVFTTVADDLAVTYHVVLYGFKDGTGTVAISNNILKNWEISVEELHETAVKNLQTFQRSTCQSMFDVLFESMGKSYINDFDGDEEQAKEAFSQIIPNDGNMLVASNINKVFGASCLLDVPFMAHLVEQYGRDGQLTIIPSSVHEVLILGCDFPKENIDSMIVEENSTTVDVEDQLSDHAYIYDIKHGLMSA